MGSSKERMLVRLKTIPSDLTWSELTVVLKMLGFEQREGNGSRVKFVGPGNILIHLHRPHPAKEIKRCYVREVVALLKEAKLIK